MLSRPRKPWSHRTPDRCSMCGTDALGAAEARDDVPICDECYSGRHDLHRTFQGGCGLCWDQYRADRRLAEVNF